MFFSCFLVNYRYILTQVATCLKKLEKTSVERWPEDVAKTFQAISEELPTFSTGGIINVDGDFHLQKRKNQLAKSASNTNKLCVHTITTKPWSIGEAIDQYSKEEQVEYRYGSKRLRDIAPKALANVYKRLV